MAILSFLSSNNMGTLLCILTGSQILVDLVAHPSLSTQFPPGPNLAFLKAKSLVECSNCCHLWFWPQPGIGLLEFAFPVAAPFGFWEEKEHC